MRKLCLLATVMLALAGSGCGGDGNPLCDNIVDCGAMSGDECNLFFDTFILSDTCLTAIEGASCGDHTSRPAAYWDTCFAPCTGNDATCSGDTITTCYEDHTMVMRCEGACKFADKSYTGTCADEYQGQPSGTGQDVCWCE